jgi:ketosteroid isomerase-like protein
MSVAHRFYDAFAARDWQTVGGLYADDARFSDPAFSNLDAAQVRAMWRMLLTRGKDLAVVYEVLNETPTDAQVRWTATYTFTQTGRRVTNVITAALSLRNGRIVRHLDVFDFHKWSAQALGPVGMLLGWTPWLQRKVQGKAMAGLRDFMNKQDGQR